MEQEEERVKIDGNLHFTFLNPLKERPSYFSRVSIFWLPVGGSGEGSKRNIKCSKRFHLLAVHTFPSVGGSGQGSKRNIKCGLFFAALSLVFPTRVTKHAS